MTKIRLLRFKQETRPAVLVVAALSLAACRCSQQNEPASAASHGADAAPPNAGGTGANSATGTGAQSNAAGGTSQNPPPGGGGNGQKPPPGAGGNSQNPPGAGGTQNPGAGGTQNPPGAGGAQNPPPPITGTLRKNPKNGRYFIDSTGKAVLLAGAHTWMNLNEYGSSDPPKAFNYDAYISFLKAKNHNFFRLWDWEQTRWAPWTTDAIWFSQSIYQRTGPGNARDGKPKIDVTKFNDAYFSRMRARVVQAGKSNIYASVMLFDGFSIGLKGGGGNAWPGHPYNIDNNINGLDGDQNHDGSGDELHTMKVPAVTAAQEAYVKKVIDTVGDLDNVLYEISNESNADSVQWQYHIIDVIKAYEATKPKQHPVGMTIPYPNGNNADLWASAADWVAPNDQGGYAGNPPPADGKKVVVLDTDHLGGHTFVDPDWSWRAFMRGYNVLFMDCYDGADPGCAPYDPNNPKRLQLIANLGYARSFSTRIDFATLLPHGELATSTFCLANPVASGAEYLVYLPRSAGAPQVDVDLSATPGSLTVEWFDPTAGASHDGGKVTGGARKTFTAPFSGDAVLHLYGP